MLFSGYFYSFTCKIVLSADITLYLLYERYICMKYIIFEIFICIHLFYSL